MIELYEVITTHAHVSTTKQFKATSVERAIELAKDHLWNIFADNCFNKESPGRWVKKAKFDVYLVLSEDNE